MNGDVKNRAFLIFCSVGLVPIALGYGARPSVTMDALFGIKVDTTNLTHILRAVMGLYFGMVVLWLWGAFDKAMEATALVACAVFMLGLAAGRILSFILDGMPHWLLIVYAVLEIRAWCHRGRAIPRTRFTQRHIIRITPGRRTQKGRHDESFPIPAPDVHRPSSRRPPSRHRTSPQGPTSCLSLAMTSALAISASVAR